MPKAVDFDKIDVRMVTPGQTVAIKSLMDFIPVHRYPFNYEVGHGEIGMLAEGGNPLKAYERIFYKDFHV